MERHGRSRVITFFTEESFNVGANVRLGEDAAQHARVRRVGPDEPARLLDGQGRVGQGRIVNVERQTVTVAITSVEELAPPSPLEVIVPVADKDRMLVAAEKCAEQAVTGWRPAWFARSRSVSQRGEGEKFRTKVVARMQAALEQSGSAWLPRVHEERELLDVMETIPPRWSRILLDSSGTSLVQHISNTAIALAIGPEGGLEPGELERARAAGWAIASLGPTTLRFETAIIAAVSVVRALQHSGTSEHG